MLTAQMPSLRHVTHGYWLFDGTGAVCLALATSSDALSPAGNGCLELGTETPPAHARAWSTTMLWFFATKLIRSRSSPLAEHSTSTPNGALLLLLYEQRSRSSAWAPE